MERYVKDFYKLSPEEQLEFFGTYGDRRMQTQRIQKFIQKMRLPLCVGITVAGLSLGGAASVSADLSPPAHLFRPLEPALNVPTESTAKPNNQSTSKQIQSKIGETTASADLSPPKRFLQRFQLASDSTPKPNKKTTVAMKPEQTQSKVVDQMEETKKESSKPKQVSPKPTILQNTDYIQTKKSEKTKQKIDFSDIPIETESEKKDQDVFLITNKLAKTEKVQPFHYDFSEELDETQVDLTISGTIKKSEPVEYRPTTKQSESKEVKHQVDKQQESKEFKHQTDDQQESKEFKHQADDQKESKEFKHQADDQKESETKRQTYQVFTHLEQLLNTENIKEIIIKTETKTYLIKEITHEQEETLENKTKSSTKLEKNLSKF